MPGLDVHDAALLAAGAVAALTAVVHGVLMQRHMVRPYEALASRAPDASRKLTVALLHFTTFNWLLSGLALVVAAFWLDGPMRVAVAILPASSFLYAVLGNMIATRARHMGWVLYGLALALTVYGVSPLA